MIQQRRFAEEDLRAALNLTLELRGFVTAHVTLHVDARSHQLAANHARVLATMELSIVQAQVWQRAVGLVADLTWVVALLVDHFLKICKGKLLEIFTNFC